MGAWRSVASRGVINPTSAHCHTTITVPSTRRAQRRAFVTTPHLHLRTTELTSSNLSNLRVNPNRLWDTIHSTAKWTDTQGIRQPKDIKTAGLRRLTLSNEDKAARDWFIHETQSLGCKTHVDQIGNIFAIRPGLKNDKPATFVGSHLDSQPSGGRFDGILGVTAGLEMLRTLNEHWIETEGPVGVINWTNEEGARFPISMMGSGVWSGRIPLRTAWDVQSVIGQDKDVVVTVKQELERIGYLGATPANPVEGVPIGAHFELHIEQGPKLETAGQYVGVVEGVQAYKWFTVTITGREAHAGTTSLEHRADALYTAAEFMTALRKIAQEHGGLATVGILKLEPGSVNTIPGEVKLSLDMRHPQDEKLRQMIDRVQDCAGRLCERSRNTGSSRALTEVSIGFREDFSSDAVSFDDEAIRCIEEGARGVLGDGAEDKVRRMTSGAGHDSVCTSLHCPTAMIFVPCKDGVSHNPAEWCDLEDCARGADVLMHSVLRMDRLRQKKGEFD
jgi:hydantoinase/carbamoylase family amidase